MNAISPSAKGVACLRHIEVSTSRDTLAGFFCDREGRELADAWLELCPYTARTVAIRGRYIEDTAAKYIEEHGIKQMLNIAAGLSTFPYRHHAARLLDIYAELDLPDMMNFKENRIKELIDNRAIEELQFPVKYVPIDLSSESFSADFRNMDWNWKRPSIYVFEGMSYYLPFDTLQHVIDTFYDTMAPGSVLVMDFFPDYVQNNEELSALLAGLPKAGAETCVTYLSASDVEELLQRYTIVSDRLESDLECEYYADRISKPIGSIVIAEKRP